MVRKLPSLGVRVNAAHCSDGRATHSVAVPQWKPESGSRPPVRHVEELIGLGQIGYIKGIQLKLDEIGDAFPEHADFVAEMRTLIDRFDLDQYMATLKTLHSYDH